LGCRGVVVHTGSHLGLGFDHIKDNLVVLIKKIPQETQNTPLLLENSSGQKGKIGTLDELEYLLKAIPDKRLGVCLDTAHLFEAGVDIKEYQEINTYVEQLSQRSILSRVALLHLNDSRTALGSTKDEHENIGMGQIGKDGIKNFINHKDLAHLPLILEVPGMDGNGPDLANIQVVKTLL
jgi:deoxyribonuclease IV